ncbi:MAG: ATP-dependent DNA ligase [Planctomyces sp.]|nr:ATP-dependent DNA ligase [Planctomyces sp.]
MGRFAAAYKRLDSTTRTSEKVAALEDYFRHAAPRDAAWALWFLVGGRPKRVASAPELRRWVAQETGLDGWLVDECHGAVGDLSETITLLLPEPIATADPPLWEVAAGLRSMRRLGPRERHERVVAWWRSCDRWSRLVLHKLVSGSFRVGVSRALAVRALAGVSGLDPATLEHRVMGAWEPTEEALARIVRAPEPAGPAADGPADLRPYPFCLAVHLADGPEALGDPGQWLAEWKWDGVRGQLICRRGAVALWSRGEEVITDRFPEIAAAASDLPDGTVLDGEVLAWDDQAGVLLEGPAGGAGVGDAGPGVRGRPMPFAQLQTRVTRAGQESRLFHDVPAVFMAYDLLEDRGRDVRGLGTLERRRALEGLLPEAGPGAAAGGAAAAGVAGAIRRSPAWLAHQWGELAAQRARSRQLGVEGLMLKHVAGPYGVGRARQGAPGWWKWKIDPYTIDAVLVGAQRGSGRRASLYTDYTFALWSGPEPGAGELVPVAKAYSGLSDPEILLVDRYVRQRAADPGLRAGPRAVEPGLVFELAFDGVTRSARHRSGLAVRFPRMARWRHDKSPAQADTLATLAAMLPAGLAGLPRGGDGRGGRRR